MKARFLAFVMKYLTKLIVATCRVEVSGAHYLTQASGPAAIALWHNRLLLIAHFAILAHPKRHFCAIVSKSRDGEIVAQYAKSFKQGRTIRVPHDARKQALKTIIIRLKLNREIMIITPDGPRGPAFEVKRGIILAAQEAQATVIPFTWEATRCWHLKTWDRLMIPKPFSTLKVAFLAPLKSPTKEQLEQALNQEGSRATSITPI